MIGITALSHMGNSAYCSLASPVQSPQKRAHLRAPARLQLREHPRDMMAGGMDAHAETSRDALIGVPFGQQLHDFGLPRSKSMLESEVIGHSCVAPHLQR